MNHEESILHLQFCKFLKKEYPALKFVRNERERQRSFANQNMMRVYNSLDGLPDFELLATSTSLHGIVYSGLYIEFKRPGRNWTLADGKTLAAGFEAQYACHKHLWSIGRCAYFCNDFEVAKELLIAYLDGKPFPMQDYLVREDKSDLLADDFFGGRNL